MTIPVKKISTFCKTGSGGTPSRSNNAFLKMVQFLGLNQVS